MPQKTVIATSIASCMLMFCVQGKNFMLILVDRSYNIAGPGLIQPLYYHCKNIWGCFEMVTSVAPCMRILAIYASCYIYNKM